MCFNYITDEWLWLILPLTMTLKEILIINMKCSYKHVIYCTLNNIREERHNQLLRTETHKHSAHS